MSTSKLKKVIGLEERVIELQESVGLLVLQTAGNGVLFHHRVDGEELSDVAQELDIADLVEPVGIVDHDGIRRAIAESQEGFERFADAFDILRNRFLSKNWARFLLVGRVTDFGGAAAHKHDWLAASLLQAAQHHDSNE